MRQNHERAPSPKELTVWLGKAVGAGGAELHPRSESQHVEARTIRTPTEGLPGHTPGALEAECPSLASE